MEDYTPDKLVADIFALADAMGVENFTVVGHDWGGAIAWVIALKGQVTGRVDRAIIMNAPHPYVFQKMLIENAEQRAASQYIRGFRDAANDDMIREKGLVAILKQEVAWDRSPAMTDEDRAINFRNWQEPDAAFSMLNWYRGSKVVVPAMGEDAPRPTLLDTPFPNLMLPTLVIWATDDLALPSCNLEGLEDHVPNITIERVPEVGHFITWEAPDIVNAAMDVWLKQN